MNDKKRKRIYEEISGLLHRLMVEENNHFSIEIENGTTRKVDKSCSWYIHEPNDTQTITIRINGGATKICEEAAEESEDFI